MQDLKFNITSEKETTTILVGTANTPDLPQKLILKGDFTAVSNFMKVKNADANDFQYISKRNSIVVCDKENLTIQLLTDPNDKNATEITGKAEFSKEMQTFGINENKFFNREQLIKLFRFNRRFFPNKEENANLLMTYQNFTASVNKSIQEESDLRGNKNNQFQKKVNTSLPENFVIEVPIFKGEKAVSFPVEICMEDYDSGIRFWFESVELSELVATKTDELFDRELKSVKDLAVIFK